MTAETGILLVNLGTPDSPSVPDVRRYLAEFLWDERVVDIHPVARWLLLHGIILRFRPSKSAHAYRQVWTEQGSPLLVHGRALTEALQARFEGRAVVKLAMRYGRPSIDEALDAFELEGISDIAVLPLFPQQAAATTGSAIEAVQRAAAARWHVPVLRFIGEFYAHPAWIRAVVAAAREALEAAPPDHVVLSFHGVPERHVTRGDASGAHCLKKDDCCARIEKVNRRCYRAQCYATGRALTRAMNLPEDKVTICFQSRLGRTPWLQPYADAAIAELGRKGLKRVLVIEPSFVADCLETLEEIGMRAREDFEAQGGGQLVLAPCVNAHESWVDAVQQLIEEDLAGLRTADRGR